MILLFLWCAILNVKAVYPFRCAPEKRVDSIQYLRRAEPWNDILYYCPPVSHQLIGPVQRKCLNDSVWYPVEVPGCEKVCKDGGRLADTQQELGLKVHNRWIFCKRGYEIQDDLLSCADYVQWAREFSEMERRCITDEDELVHFIDNPVLVTDKDDIHVVGSFDEVHTTSAEKSTWPTVNNSEIQSDVLVWSLVVILFVLCQCFIVFIMYKFKTRVLNSFQVTLAIDRTQECAT